MGSLREHITILNACGQEYPITDVLARCIISFMQNHYVGKDNTHDKIKGQEGFVDDLGDAMTLDEFYKAIAIPEPPPPPPPFKQKWQYRVRDKPKKTIQGLVDVEKRAKK